MALKTKTLTGSTGSDYWTWKTVVTEDSGSAVDKKSQVTVTNYLGRKTSAGGSYFMGSATIKYTAGGQSYSENFTTSSRVDVSAGGWYKMGSHTFEVDNKGTNDEPTNISVSGSMSGASFSPTTASASGSLELTVLHTMPDLTLSSITENNTNLSGVGGTTFVTNLSKKIFNIGYTLYDDATINSIKIYDRAGNELSATITITTDSSSATIEVDFSKQVIPANAISNNTTSFSIDLIDSLGGMTSVITSDYSIIPYFLPNLITTSSSVKRNGQLTGKVLLNLLGSFYNSSVGNTTNGITLSFKYWQLGGTEPSTYNSIPSDVNSGTGNNINISKWKVAINNTEITDVNKSYAYKFKIKAVDSFGNINEIELTCSKGEWLMARFKDRVDFKKITQGGVDVATKNDIQKNIAYLKLNESSTLTWDAWTDVKVPLEKQLIIGNKLTFDNNRVKIGAGVSKVRVTGNIRFDCLVATGAISAKTHITKADETVSVPITTFNTKPNTTVDFTETIPECIVEVSEGDVIGIAFQTGTANSSKNLKAGTNLIVEVIE